MVLNTEKYGYHLTLELLCNGDVTIIYIFVFVDLLTPESDVSNLAKKGPGQKVDKDNTIYSRFGIITL